MGSHPGRGTPLTDVLLQRIARQGPLTFAAFMEACLYHPQHGYYTRHAAGQRTRDYITSPEVGPLFGRLLARQLAEMWGRLDQPRSFELVECGAGRGVLAGDILAAVSQQSPDFAAALRLTLVEASSHRRAEAEQALSQYGEQVRTSERLPGSGVVGCLLSNELVDALPVQRVVQRPEGLREIYVSARGEELVEEEGKLSSPEITRYLERYGVPLEVGQLAEVHLAALAWLEQAAAALERGFLVTIDYGHRARELYGLGHLRGTLLTYRNHRAHEDWLGWPGEQDLTAHVNFTALEERGRELGLRTLGFTPQTQFLLALARASDFADLAGVEASEAYKLRARLQLKQLIHPEGMGETFKVLIQGKNVAPVRLIGLQPL